METILFKKLHPNAILPTKNEGDIGWDFYVVSDDSIETGRLWKYSVSSNKQQIGFVKNTRRIFHTGLAVSLPKGLNLLLWDRSGNAVKQGLHLFAGVIDSSYTGEILICLHNFSGGNIKITEGDRIAQGILQWEVPANVRWTEELQETQRGSKGFGSSGN